MSMSTLINLGMGIINSMGDSAVDGKTVADQVDTATASSVVGDLLGSLVSRTDNNIDDALLKLVQGSVDLGNIDNLIVGYLESLAAKSNNSIDDQVVAMVKTYLAGRK
jgi:hypothetical protein